MQQLLQYLAQTQDCKLLLFFLQDHLHFIPNSQEVNGCLGKKVTGRCYGTLGPHCWLTAMYELLSKHLHKQLVSFCP